MRERLVLFLVALVLELDESLFDIVGHVKMDFVVGIVPVHVDTNVMVAGPISGDLVMLFEDRLEMVGMCFTDIFGAKIINGV